LSNIPDRKTLRLIDSKARQRLNVSRQTIDPEMLMRIDVLADAE
jgi:hypothetical protein